MIEKAREEAQIIAALGFDDWVFSTIDSNYIITMNSMPTEISSHFKTDFKENIERCSTAFYHDKTHENIHFIPFLCSFLIFIALCKI